MLLGFFAVACAILISVFLGYYALHQLTDTARWVSHTNQVRVEIYALESAVKDGQRGVRGYIITQRKEQLDWYLRGRRDIGADFDKLQALTADNERQQKRLAQLRPVIDNLLGLLAREVDAIESGETREANRFVLSGAADMEIDQIGSIMAAMRAEEEALLAEREAKSRRSKKIANLSFILAAFLTLFILLGVFAVILRNQRQMAARSQELAAMHAEVQRRAEELEVRVLERTKELRETNASLEAFAYSVSHDLRAPLRGISGLGTALLEDYQQKLDPQGQEYLHGMVDSARRMDALIEQLLAYTRVNRHTFRPERVNVKDAIFDAWHQLASEVTKAGAEMHMDACPAVLASRSLLTQAIANLVSNAIKFVAPGQRPQVRIVCKEDDGKVQISVVDNGIGIDPSRLHHVFTAFERLHGSDLYAGSGLGLSIVKTAVERMAGSVGVESTPGRGSRFWIELPKA